MRNRTITDVAGNPGSTVADGGDDRASARYRQRKYGAE